MTGLDHRAIRLVKAHTAGVDLFEREQQLAVLRQYADDVVGGAGRLVLVAGEAGAGKSSLVEAVQETVPELRWAWGLCDGGFTPRALGPLFDLAPQLGDPLATAATAGAGREPLFAALLEALADTPTALVFEDVHWADEATLDLISFLARRVSRLPALVVVTYRDDGLLDHAWRAALGRVASMRSTRRVGVPPLGPESVAKLAVAAGRDPAQVHALTGGNPYFVTELLSTPASSVTPSARDAVLARVSDLPHGTRTVLHAAATIGTRVDHGQLMDVVPLNEADLDALLDCGLLTGEGTGLRFRHELARLAVLESVPAHRLADLHRRVLSALLDRGSDDQALLAHHAEGCGDGPAVLTHAVAAADRAAQLSAHREAAAQYERALRWIGNAERKRADLLDRLATELGLLDRWEESEEVRRDALAMWQQLGDTTREGGCLHQLSRTLWRLGRGAESTALLGAAVGLLEPLGSSPELARTLVQQSAHAMINGRFEEAIARAEVAVELGREQDLPDVVADALNNLGTSTYAVGGDGGQALSEGIAVATGAGLGEQAGRAHTNRLGALLDTMRYAEADRAFAEAWVWCGDHDVPTYGNCLLGERAELLERTSRWDEAVAVAKELLHQPRLSPVNRLHAWLVCAQIGLRRGDPDGVRQLDEGQAVADGTDEPQWLLPFGLTRVECHWLAGEDDEALATLLPLLPLADRAAPCHRGSAAVWAHRLGADIPVADVMDPFRLEIAGDTAEAARRWLDLGVDYAAALALSLGDQETEWRKGLEMLDRLGADAAARSVRRRLRSAGARGLGHGRRADTLAHPAGLTRREHEVLTLLADGLTNDEIAASLVISAKTVDHHVSAVLGKLGVPHRRAASEAARERGLLTGDGESVTTR